MIFLLIFFSSLDWKMINEFTPLKKKLSWRNEDAFITLSKKHNNYSLKQLIYLYEVC